MTGSTNEGEVMGRGAFFSRLALAALLLFTLFAGGCKNGQELSAKDFVGTWKSSRATTPIAMHDNGEWELMAADGGVMQYGVWQYFDRKLMWSYIIDERFGHDTNPIVSASPAEFRLREADGSITTFVRLK